MRTVRDRVSAGLGGFIATKAMEPVTTKLYELESGADRQREPQDHPARGSTGSLGRGRSTFNGPF